MHAYQFTSQLSKSHTRYRYLMTRAQHKGVWRIQVMPGVLWRRTDEGEREERKDCVWSWMSHICTWEFRILLCMQCSKSKINAMASAGIRRDFSNNSAQSVFKYTQGGFEVIFDIAHACSSHMSILSLIISETQIDPIKIRLHISTIIVLSRINFVVSCLKKNYCLPCPPCVFDFVWICIAHRNKYRSSWHKLNSSCLCHGYAVSMYLLSAW